MNITVPKQFSIADIQIGKDKPCFIIAEIGINHNGSIDIAKKLIDEAKNAGANAVKFQKRDINSIYREDVLENPNIESQGFEILLDVLRKVEFCESDYREIIRYCHEKNIVFLCTPWDIPSVKILELFNVPAYKIASADLTNLPLIKYIAKTKKPVIISTGMSTLEEIEKTVEFMENEKMNFVILHSNSTYPAPIEILNLNLIPFYESKFKCLVGYSGHEQKIIPSLVATVLGAVILERHITLDRNMEGIDQSSSLEPSEFSQLVMFVREAEKARGKPIKKMSRGEILQREILGKSLISKKNIEKDEIFTEQNIDVKGPAKGLSPQHYFDMMGKKSKRDIKKGLYLQTGDL